MTDFQRKCPLCNGGVLVRSRSNNSGYTFYFWKKPWKRKFFDFGVERVYPWACMGCGVVLLYLERLPAIAEEYRTAAEPSTAASGAPAPIQP
ncbi:MAG: hypothetical protein M3S32_03405 [Acidobacteriota bacterium]|nr:hypothetical protein [Acidobacteriota bacterium]